MVAGSLVLIVPEKPVDNRKSKASVVVAAPDSVRKSLDKQILSGAQPQNLAPPPQLPVQLQLPRQDAQLSDLRGEVEDKFKVQEQMASTEAKATEAAAQVRDEMSGLVQAQEEKFQRVEDQVQAISASVCTKTDMSNLLQEALARQSAEFRVLMAKRSPEPSPVHNQQENKAQKTS